MAIFGPKQWVNPFGKMLIFGLFRLIAFIAQKGVFSFQHIIKDILLAFISLKNKVQNEPFLAQNHGLIPLEKCQFFGFLNFLFLQPTKSVFWFQNIIKDIFLAYIAQKKRLVKWPFLDQNHGLIPLEKCQIFGFLNFFFLQPTKRHFPGLYCLKKKVAKMAIFGSQRWVNPFGKMSIFRLFKLLVFKAQKERFLVLEYYKRHFPGSYCLKKKVGKMAIFGPKLWVNAFGKNNVNFSTF